MLKPNKQALGRVTRSRTALILFAATVFSGGTATEASARSYRHHHHHHHNFHHVARASVRHVAQVSNPFAWREAHAAVTPSFGGGRSFSGMASFYGNESGSRTASGQRFNQNALTPAHRSLPFGTRLRVTHGDR